MEGASGTSGGGGGCKREANGASSCCRISDLRCSSSGCSAVIVFESSWSSRPERVIEKLTIAIVAAVSGVI